MGRADKLQRDYMSSNERFADLFNYYLFAGEQVIKPESLREQSVNELVAVYGKDKKVSIKERYRDLLRGCLIRQSEQAVYMLLGLENQDEVHYAMPVRQMLYDAMNYTGQASKVAKRHRARKDQKGSAEFLSGFGKDDKLKPVVTLTLYWGTDKWDGPRSLHDMLDVKDKRLLNCIENYRLNLITPQDIRDFGLFRSDLRYVLDFVSKAADRQALRQYVQNKEEILNSMDVATFALISRYFDGRIKESEGGTDTMKIAQGILDWEAEAKAEGKAEGEANKEKEAIEKMAAYFMKQDKTMKKKQARELAESILR